MICGVLMVYAWHTQYCIDRTHNTHTEAVMLMASKRKSCGITMHFWLHFLQVVGQSDQIGVSQHNA